MSARGSALQHVYHYRMHMRMSLSSASDPMPEPLRVRRLGEADAGSIAEFFRAAAWDPHATPEGARKMLRALAAENPFEPGKEPPTVGVFVGTRLAGFVTTHLHE